MRSFLPVLSFTALSFTALSVSALSATSAVAAELAISFQAPQLKVAQYHRPYVAIWLENAERTRAADLALFYNQRGGDSWLKDLRTWWRKGGRDVRMPIDGVSGATRPPGVHAITVPGARLARLPAGQYNVVIEAAREAGGRETLTVPVQLPLKAGSAQKVTGTDELGAFSVVVRP